MTEWVLVPREPTAKMVLAAFDAITNASGEGMIRARWRCMLDAAPAAPQQAEPVGYFVNDESDDQWHQVDYEQRNGADTYPLYLHPPAAEVRLQGGLDNEELLEAWRTKVPGVEPTDSDLRAFALGVEFGTRGKRVYFDERNSARDAWRRRVKQCETLEAEVQRLRDALEQIEREANQPYIQRIAAAALKVGE